MSDPQPVEIVVELPAPVEVYLESPPSVDFLVEVPGPRGPQGIQGAPGPPGDDGPSAYDVAVSNGFVGTESEWLDSLQGAAGPPGGPQGAPGLSAYDLAVLGGFTGTLDEWEASLHGAPGSPGAPGPQGLSDYDLAVINGFTGSLADWLDLVTPPVSHREELTGALDGVNTTFTTTHAFAAGSTVVYLNGLAQTVPYDYAEIAVNEVQMVEPPLAGDRLLITYLEA